MQSCIPSAGSGSISSVEEVEAIVRRVLADTLAKQHGGPVASRSTNSGEMLNLKDFELPDDLDLGSTFTTVTLPNEIKHGGEGEKGATDADTVDPESLYDKAAEEIGNLEQKLALSNASNEMATEEIKRLKSIIEDQSQEINGLKKERKMERDHLEGENFDYREENLNLIEEKDMLLQDKESWAEEKAVMTEEIRLLKSFQAHLEANISDYRKKYVSLSDEKTSLEEKLSRQKCELATLNKKVEKSSKGKRGGGGGVNLDLMARIERQARLNKKRWVYS